MRGLFLCSQCKGPWVLDRHRSLVSQDERTIHLSLGPQVAIGAFVMPNKPIDPNAPLTSFAVPLERLESVAGLKYVSGADHELTDVSLLFTLAMSSSIGGTAGSNLRIKVLYIISSKRIPAPERFFPHYIDDKRRRALDHAAEEWQKTGQAILRLQKGAKGGGADPLLPPAKEPAALPETSSASSPSVSKGNGGKGSNGITPAMKSVLYEPKTRGGNGGVVHVCDHAVCDLVKPGWWEKEGKGGKGKNGLGPEPHSVHPRR